MANLGQAVRTLRKRRGLTQGELALYAQIDQSYISQIENGHVDSVGGQILRRLAEKLETTTDYLLGLTTDPERRGSVVGYELTERERILLKKFMGLPKDAQEYVMAGLDAILRLNSTQ